MHRGDKYYYLEHSRDTSLFLIFPVSTLPLAGIVSTKEKRKESSDCVLNLTFLPTYRDISPSS